MSKHDGEAWGGTHDRCTKKGGGSKGKEIGGCDNSPKGTSGSKGSGKGNTGQTKSPHEGKGESK